MSLKLVGSILSWVPERRYGFVQWIDADGRKRSTFMHETSLLRCVDYSGRLAPGTRVTFELGHDARGRVRAINVTVRD